MSGTEERRVKVKAFYEKYAPTEMAKIENAVNAKFTDEALFKMLRDKYKLQDSTDPIALGKSAAPASPASPASPGGGDDAKRGRISAFYQKYAPTEMAKVDNAVKYKGSEDELFKMLRDKYKLQDSTDPVAFGKPAEAAAAAAPAPAVAAAAATPAAAAGGGGGDTLRDRIKAFYEKHAPQDIHRVDKTLGLGLPEEDLFARLKQKYGVTDGTAAAASPSGSPGGAAPAPAAAAGGGGDTLRDRVKAFYEKHAPQDIHRVDKTLGLGLPEEDLFARLKQKYGVTDDGSPARARAGSAAPSSSGAGGSTDALREKVKAFYEKHAPQDVHRVDKTLGLGLSEEDLLARLRQKYGVKDDAGTDKSSSVASSAAATPVPAAAGGGGGDTLRDRVKAFYEKHAPQDIHRVDKTLGLGLSEEDLFARLKQKYGVTDDNSSPGAAAAAASPPGSPGNASFSGDPAKRERIKAFYEKHAPQDLRRLDKTLALDLPEEELLNRLRQKYGVVEEAPAPAPAPAPAESTKPQVSRDATPATSKPTTPRQAVPPEPEMPKEDPMASSQRSNNNNNVATPSGAPAGGYSSAHPEPEQHPGVEGPSPTTGGHSSSKQQRPVPMSAEMQQPMEHRQQEQQQQQQHHQNHHQNQQQQQQQYSDPNREHINVPQLQNPSAVNHYVSTFMQGQSGKIQDLLFTLQQREEAVGMREAAAAAREASFESRCLSLGAEPTRLIFDAAGQQTAEFVAHLVDVEATLAAATADLVRFEKLLRQQERDISDRDLAVQKREESARAMEQEKTARMDDRARDLKLQQDRVTEQQAAGEQERRRLSEWSSQLATKESEMSKREAMVAAQAELNNQRDAQLELQQDATAKEREASRRFSEELLQREGTVRAVERSLNAARSELTRMENDVALHAKKLLEDQRALRRWSEELERREERFNRKNPNSKG